MCKQKQFVSAYYVSATEMTVPEKSDSDMYFFSQLACPYALIRYDTEKEEPVRNSKGFCIKVPTGEPICSEKKGFLLALSLH